MIFVSLSSTTYTQFYFELRDLSEEVFPLKPLSDGAAVKLEAQGTLTNQLISSKAKRRAKEGCGSRSLTENPETKGQRCSGKFVLS
jgi:hypothetical protein